MLIGDAEGGVTFAHHRVCSAGVCLSTEEWSDFSPSFVAWEGRSQGYEVEAGHTSRLER